MTRPTVEVADIFRAEGKNFIDRHRNTIRFQQLKVMHVLVLIVESTCSAGDVTVARFNKRSSRSCDQWSAAGQPEIHS